MRELDSNLALADEALKRGYKVVLGESDEVKAFARHVGGGVYVYKHWESKFPYKFDLPERRHFLYAGLHQEGVVWIDNDTFLRRITERGRSENLDINFVKGQLQQQLLVEFYTAIAPKVRVSGAPTFDILRPEFRLLFAGKVEELQRQWGQYVLVDTNFSQGNRRKFDTDDILVEREKSSIKNVGRPLTEEEKKIIIGGMEYKHRLFEEYGAMLHTLSKQFPHINFILRPHPSENHDTWREALRSLPNVHVIFKDNVVNWILGSVAVVQTGCTTALEAWAVGKPVIRYNPLGKTSPYESELPNQFGAYTSTPEELAGELQRVLDGDDKRALAGEASTLKPYMDSVDGELAIVRIMNTIDATGQFENYTSVERDRTSYLTFKKKLKMFAKRIASLVLRYEGLTKYILGEQEAVRRAAPYQKFPGLSAEIVRSGLAQLAKLRGSASANALRIRRVDVTTFVVERL